jgi:hypothetical protein
MGFVSQVSGVDNVQPAAVALQDRDQPLSAATVDARRQYPGVQLPARPGTTVWSQHAYGLAVEINPFENPKSATAPSTLPPAAGAGRSRPTPAMITHGDAVWNAFNVIGWTWGGDWTSPKDYMHFSANGL